MKNLVDAMVGFLVIVAVIALTILVVVNVQDKKEQDNPPPRAGEQLNPEEYPDAVVVFRADNAHGATFVYKIKIDGRWYLVARRGESGVSIIEQNP